MSDKKKDPPIIHIKVTVHKEVNPSTGEQEYVPKYKPEVIPVTESDTILNFRLDDKTPDDIYIQSVKYKPEDNTQLSPPSISKNKKQVTLSDVNTSAETLQLTFEFGNTPANSAIERMAVCLKTMSDEYPQVINEPPP